MSKLNLDGVKGKLLSRNVHRWAQAAQKAVTADFPTLRRQRKQARQLKVHLDKVIRVADERLALPMIGSNTFLTPHNADWSWRPGLWRTPLDTPGLASVQTKSMLGEEVTLFHDCALSELSLRQLRNLRKEDLAPYGLRMDVFQFDGSFLSLVLDLPQAGTDALKRSHIIQMDTIVELENPLEIFARLNVKHGPNTEQIVRELPPGSGNHTVEFDLAYSSLNEKRVERAWIDLIFEGPKMNQVILRDLTLSRRPRAAL